MHFDTDITARRRNQTNHRMIQNSPKPKADFPLSTGEVRRIVAELIG